MQELLIDRIENAESSVHDFDVRLQDNERNIQLM